MLGLGKVGAGSQPEQRPSLSESWLGTKSWSRGLDHVPNRWLRKVVVFCALRIGLWALVCVSSVASWPCEVSVWWCWEDGGSGGSGGRADVGMGGFLLC